jgi:regulation of enolase protein 1 (concanavalin A-like superfamily)
MDDFAGFSWLNEPSHAELRGPDLFVRASNATDYWRGTFYNFWRDSGHFHEDQSREISRQR